MQEALRERLRLEADIDRALAHGEFFLEYQPVVELRTGTLLGCRGARALAAPRARRADAAAVHPPGRGIGSHHRARPLRAAAGLRGLAPLVRRDGDGRRACTSPSTSRAVTCSRATWCGTSPGRCEQSGLAPANLVIELTESTMMHNTEANLERLRAAEGARCPARDRRLRHGLLVACLPASVPDRHPQDRSFVRPSPGDRGRRPRAGARRRRASATRSASTRLPRGSSRSPRRRRCSRSAASPARGSSFPRPRRSSTSRQRPS